MARRTSLRLQSQTTPHPDSQQTTRVNTGRNRLGCHTCRIRRKKCDEQKDASKGGSCDTCLRLNIECLGWGPSRPSWCSNEKELHAFKETTKRKIARKRGGLDIYNDQSSEEFLCETSSGSSGAFTNDHSPHLSFSPSPEVFVSLPLPDHELSAAVVDTLQMQQFVTLACELAATTGVDSPLLDTLRQMADLAYWKANQVSAAALDDGDFQYRMQVISDEIQNSILPIPFNLLNFGYANGSDISGSLFEVNRTACLLLLDGIRAGLRSSSPGLAEWVKEVQTQVNAVSFLRHVLPEQYLFAACIAKAFAADTDMSFMNALTASINDQSIKTTAHLLLAMAHAQDAVW